MPASLGAEQIPIDEIFDDKYRVARAWVSAEVKDRQGQIVDLDDLKRSMDVWMMRDAPINDTHTNRKIGKGLNWGEGTHPITKGPAIWVKYQIHDDYSEDNTVWNEIKSGKRTGVSIGAKTIDRPKMVKDSFSGEKAQKLNGIELYEISSVDMPAMQFATNDMVNFVAKSLNDFSMEELSKGFESIDIQKPFAGFSDFASCVTAQKKRGHSDESADRICGYIKTQTEKMWKETRPVLDEKPTDEIPEENSDSKSLNKEITKSDNMDLVSKNDIAKEGSMTSDANKDFPTPPAPAQAQSAPAAPEPSIADVVKLVGELSRVVSGLAEGQKGMYDKLAAMEVKPKDEDDVDKGTEPSGNVKLPKASAGEADENAPKAGEEVKILAKQMSDIQKDMGTILKSLGSQNVMKSMTPRPESGDFINKNGSEDKNPAVTMMKNASQFKTEADVQQFAKALENKTFAGMM